MSVFSINTQPKNAFNLEAAAKHGDLRSMKRVKNIVLNKNKACYWNAKCKFRCLINNYLFDHRETCRQPATLGYGAFGGKIVYNLRWVGRGNYPTNLSRIACVQPLLTSKKIGKEIPPIFFEVRGSCTQANREKQFELQIRGTLELLKIIIRNIYLIVGTIMLWFNCNCGLNFIFLCFGD